MPKLEVILFICAFGIFCGMLLGVIRANTNEFAGAVFLVASVYVMVVLVNLVKMGGGAP
jgi:hypothetical protein